MLGGGLPEGSSSILQGPAGGEKLRFALVFLAEGLKTGGSGVLVIASQTAESIVSELRGLGVDLDVVAKESRLRIVDWHSWNEESITDVEERGIILRSPAVLSALAGAVGRAIAALPNGAGKRAVIEMLSPAVNVNELSQVYAFAQGTKRKLDRFGFTSLFLVEKDMHQAAVLSTLAQPFDGVIEMERTRTGDRIIRKIGVLYLREATPTMTFLPLEITDTGFRVLSEGTPARAVPAPAPPAPATRGASRPAVRAVPKKVIHQPLAQPEPSEDRRSREQLILEIARERLRVDPTDTDAWFALAAGQANLGDPTRALSSLDRLVELDPRYPGLWILKAKLHARLGQEEDWRQARMKADEFEASPGTPSANQVPCPICAQPIRPEASLCPHCGSHTQSEEGIIEELENLTKATIQDIVQESLETGVPESKAKPRIEAGPEDHRDEHAERTAPAAPVPKTMARTHKGESERGLTNGLVLERAAARRSATAAGQGRTNGLTNGLRGRTNGLTNGLGHTNGLTNGLRGRTNGLTNGLGGHTNGLSDGLQAANGLGRTNGHKNLGRMARLKRRVTRSPWTRYGIPLAVIVLLLIPLFFLWGPAGPSNPIQIDGNFADWASVTKVNAVVPASANPDIAITRVAMKDNVDFLSFYLEVQGSIVGGAPAPLQVTNGYFAFLDVDRSGATGYRVQGIGADRMVRIYTYGGQIVSATSYSFDTSRGANDWNAWVPASGVQAAGAGDRMEFQVLWSDLSPNHAPVEAAFASRSWDGQSDAADVVATSAGSYVVVTQDTRAPTILSSATPVLSTFGFHAVGADLSIVSLNVTLQGTFGPASLSAVDLVDGSGNVLAEQPPARVVHFVMSGFTVPTGANRSVSVQAKVGTADGSTVGAIVENLQDVVVAPGGVAFVRPVRTTQSLAYVGSIPGGPAVDGGFSDWPSVTPDPVGDVQPRWDSDVDLSGYAFQGRSGSTYFMARVVGTALNGTMLPAFNPVYVPPSTGTGNGTIGPPGSPPPAENGTDTLRFYLDTDGSNATGYRTGGIGADYLAEVSGKEGLILSSVAMRFAGRSPWVWNWTVLGPAPAANDGSHVEASIPGVAISNASRAYFESSGWNGARDNSLPDSPPMIVLSIATSSPLGSHPVASSPSGASRSFNVIAQAVQWFFTNNVITAGAPGDCPSGTALQASMTAGATPANVLIAGGASQCWYTPNQITAPVAGTVSFSLDLTAGAGSYTLYVIHCTKNTCSGTSGNETLGSVTSSTYGADTAVSVTISAPTGTWGNADFLEFRISKAAGGTTMTVAINGPSGGVSDSSATVPIPEFETVAVPVVMTVFLGLTFVRMQGRRRRT